MVTRKEETINARLELPEEVVAARPTIRPERLVKAFGHSCSGIASAWRTEGAFRQEVLAAAVLLPLAAFVPVPLLQRVLLAASVLFVMVVELLNTGIEIAIDRISVEHHPLSKAAKDMGSAAVLFAVLIAIMIWLAIVGPVVAGWASG